MIILVLVRRAVCATCHDWFDLSADEKPPKACRFCGSETWLAGPEDRESTYIRQRVTKNRKVLNPGVTSRNRQLWGKKQWRQFKGKPLEEPEHRAEN